MTIAIESLCDTVRKILAPPPSGDKDISVAMIRALIRRPGLVDDARAVAQGDLGALNDAMGTRSDHCNSAGDSSAND